MGNRAAITSYPYRTGNLAIYVHWNGGRESIEGFSMAARQLDFRAPSDPYGLARLCQIIGSYFGGNLSLGIGTVKDLRSCGDDNGTWILADDWSVKENRDSTGKLWPMPEHFDKEKAEAICAAIIAKVNASEAV